MQADNKTIEGGCILLSRQILTSDIWRKPPEYLKIFLYILLKVNHKDGLFPKGSNFFNFSEQKPDGVSINQVYKFLSWAKDEKVGILATQKSTRGIVIKVNNYERYQTLENYYQQDKWQDNGRTAAGQRQDYKQELKNEIIKEDISILYEEKKEKKKRTQKEFIPPTLEDVKKYCLEERKNNVDYKRFFDYYNVSDWKDGKGNPIRNWKQKIIAVWESGCKNSATQSGLRAENASNQIKKENSQEDFYMKLSR